MKKITSLLIVFAIFTLSFTAFADTVELFKYESDTPINYISYFKADFEGENGADNTAPSALVDGNNIENASPAVLKTATEDSEVVGSGYVSLGQKQNASDVLAGGKFSENITDGIVYVEFDVKPIDFASTGYFSMGLFDTAWGAGKTSWFLTIGPDGKITTNGLNGTKAVNRADNNAALTYNPEKWNHFSVELNMNSQRIIVTANGVKSKAVIMALKPGGLARAGLGMCSNASEVFLDNFHVYSVGELNTDNETGKSYYYNDGFENDTADKAPAALYGISGLSVTDEAVVAEESDNKYVNLKSTVRVPVSTRINNGRFVFEFDVKASEPLFGIGFVTTDEFETYDKWLFGFETTGEIVSFKSNGEFLPSEKQSVYIKNSSDKLTFAGNEWQHCTVVIDIDEKKAYIKVGDVASEWIEDIKGVGNSPISAITLSTAQNACIDNVEIYRHPNYVKGLSFKGFDGVLSTDTHKVSTNTEMLVVKFSNYLEIVDASYIELINNTKDEDVEFECFISNEGDTLFIKPTVSGLQGLCNYTLSISGDIADEWGNGMLEDYTISFYTQKGYIEVLKTDFIDADGNSLNSVNPGDTVYLAVDYINTGSGKKIDAILAYTAVDEGYLKDIYSENVTLSDFGKHCYKKQITIPQDISFDKIKLFLWDKSSRLPIVDALSLGGTE